jgi:hypothetical protein
MSTRWLKHLSLIKAPTVALMGLAILCSVALLAFAMQRNFLLWVDYCITFEGAYRIYCGQWPYRDFGLPVGPVSFLVPAGFFVALGPSWDALLLSQGLQNTVMLCLLVAILRQLGTHPVVIAISLLVFTLAYLPGATHPWYNSTGTLMALACVAFALRRGLAAPVLAGICAGLAVLSKQDIGLISLAFGGLFLSLSAKGLNSERIEIAHSDSPWTAVAGTVGLRSVLFGAAAVLTIVLTAWLTDWGAFWYWLNLGQPPHHPRELHPRYLIHATPGSVSLLIIVLGLARDNLRLLVSGLFLLAGTVTSVTSGNPFLASYGLAFAPVALGEALLQPARHRLGMAVLCASALWYLFPEPLANTKYILHSFLDSKVEHLRERTLHFDFPISRFPSSLRAFGRNNMAPDETIDFLLALPRTVPIAPTTEILNLSELTPIYAHWAIAPPKGIPLWFHPEVSMFEREAKAVNQLLEGDRFDLILLQEPFVAGTKSFKTFRDTLERNIAYRLLTVVQETPAAARYDHPRERKMADREHEFIRVYVKRLQ